MKKLFLSLIAIVLLSNISSGQTKVADWKKMMDNYSNSVNALLIKESGGVELSQFKQNLLDGKTKLSEVTTQKIHILTEPLINYANEFVQTTGMTADDELQLLFFSSFGPFVIFPPSGSLETNGTPGWTADEVWNCAKQAVGIGAAGSLGTFALTKAGIKILTETITKIVVKNLGWVGVAITVADFSFCMYTAYYND